MSILDLKTVQSNNIDFTEKHSLEDLLKLLSDTEEHYKLFEHDLEVAKAKIRTQTDWSKVFDKKPTESDKTAYIIVETAPATAKLRELECEYKYLKELFKLESMILKKELENKTP